MGALVNNRLIDSLVTRRIASQSAPSGEKQFFASRRASAARRSSACDFMRAARGDEIGV